MLAKPLTKAEKQWIAALQAVLDACPSERQGVYTTGGCLLSFFDSKVNGDWTEKNYRAELDVAQELEASGADLHASVTFPFNVEGRAG